MKSTIRISNNGNTIRATGASANDLFKALTEGISTNNRSLCCGAAAVKYPFGHVCSKCKRTCELLVVNG